MRKIRKFSLCSSRDIWIFSIVIFVIVAAAMLFSTYYMNICIREEQEAELRRAEYRELGENLADASDYLTEEVRYFAITGEIEHLYNYWYEIFVARTRENAITTFETEKTPENEKKLLETAKRYSDILVETEMYSMKLVLLAQGKTQADYAEEKLNSYVAHVMSYDRQTTDGMTEDEMRSKAVTILYDVNYENYKTLIMRPIEQFTETMNARLDQEVENRKTGTKIATVIQVILALMSLAAIGFLLNMMNHLYIHPLKSYTSEINGKIHPAGSAELIHFAETFNDMIGKLYEELSQRKKAEEASEKAKKEAEMANEAKSIFLAQMSHELRTPLNAVDGYTYLLEKTELKEKQKGYVKGIKDSSHGLLELINQILDFSKIESGQMEMEHINFSIKKVISEVHTMFAAKAKQKNLAFHVEIEENLPEYVTGDPLRLKQVLVNLVGNACKFTEEGSVTLSVVCLSKSSEALLFKFVVKDTGIGIRQEAIEKVFQPFTQSDASVTRKYGGTGLGLPISREIVEKSGDGSHRLEVKSEQGKGSEFTFTIDFLPGKEIEKKLLKAAEQLPDGAGKKVLVTDDSEENRIVLSEILKLCKLNVVTAESGENALEILNKQDDIDLIFMDIRMPKMDGYETSRRIRKISGYERIPLIALTADAVKEVERQAQEAGMNTCLLKPVNQQQLYESLVKYLDIPWQSPKQNEKKQQQEERALFNEGDCLDRLGQNEAALLEVIGRFLTLNQNCHKELEQYLANEQYEEAENLVHRLKGTTGTLCCEKLFDCLKAFQTELQQNKTDSYQDFQILWKETLMVLENRIKSDSVDEK